MAYNALNQLLNVLCCHLLLVVLRGEIAPTSPWIPYN